MRYYQVPRIVGFYQNPNVDRGAIVTAIVHALTTPIDRCSSVAGAQLAYNGDGEPVTNEDSYEADLKTAIRIDLEFAR